MSINKVEIQRADEIYDFVYLVGKDEHGYSSHQIYVKEIEEYCKKKGIKYLIIGDGKRELTLDEIEKLPKARNIAIHGHGLIDKKIHTISLFEDNEDSLEITKKIQTKTGAENVLFCSCYGGKLVDQSKDGNHFPKGTTLFAPSSPEETSFIVDNKVIIKIFIDKIVELKKEPLLCAFIESIKIIPQTLVIALQASDEELKSLTAHRTDRELYAETAKYIEYQLKKVITFIRDDINLDIEVDEQLSIDQIKQYLEASLKNHILHNDTKVIASILDKQKIDPALLSNALALLFNLPDFDLPEEMFKILFTHGFPPKNLIFSALNKGRDDILNFLLDNGADLSEYETLLHYAVESAIKILDTVIYSVIRPKHDPVRGCIQNIKTLIARGAYFDALNYQSMTPLDIAIDKKDYKVVKILLDELDIGKIKNGAYSDENEHPFWSNVNTCYFNALSQ